VDKPEGCDFSFFIKSLALQASIALGIIAHPITNKVEANLPHAKLIIDTLVMLKDKTKGNLTAEETGLLERFINDLNKTYAEKANNVAGEKKSYSND